MAVVMASALAAASCGSSGSDSTAASTTQPNHPVPLQFDAIPRYPDSRTAGTLTREGTTTTQSFEADGTSPEQILAYYRDNLPGWTIIEAPHALGASSDADWRGRWERSGASLDISSSPGPGLGAGTVQYSLGLTAA